MLHFAYFSNFDCDFLYICACVHVQRERESGDFLFFFHFNSVKPNKMFKIEEIFMKKL